MKLRAIILCADPATIDYVYTAEQRQLLAELLDLHPGVITPQELNDTDFQDVEVIFSTWGMPSYSTEEWRRMMPKLKPVFYAAGATDGFARPLFAAGIKVISAWQANAIPVAEFCAAQILLALKGYFRNTREIHAGRDWSREAAFTGPGVYGETVALIGAGAIATKVQELLKPFHLNVIIVPSRVERRTVSLEEVFSKAFVISNHLPNRDDNHGVLNGKLFASMRPGAVFINTGRGAQVNEAELCDVLQQRPDLTALLDVTDPEPPAVDSPFYTLPNVQLSSHIAGSINDEVHRMADYMIEELQSFLAGRPLRFEVQESMLLTSGKH